MAQHRKALDKLRESSYRLIAAAIVIPPIVARLLTDSFAKIMVLSTSIGTFCGLAGIYLSFFVDVSSGATVVLFSAALFVVVLAYSSMRARIASAQGRLANPLTTPSVDAGAFH